jgi:hypothetical protein
MNYLLTFPCYGSHLHGAPEGSVDRKHNRYGAPFAKPNPGLLAGEKRLMNQPAYELDEARRQAVMAGILDRCKRHDWSLLAAHVRSDHVIEADAAPEFVMTQLKCAASRSLNELGYDHPTRKRRARHGSTRRILGRPSLQRAIRYVLEGQGKPMTTY